MKKYLNDIELKSASVGNERRLELLSQIVKDGTFLPKTVEYSDIENASELKKQCISNYFNIILIISIRKGYCIIKNFI